ncbi:hypothetical protein GPJ56_007158 [Histomonas meleagridis]|uniref:uncharacterized protein n=1 Tax=Histomonas meleagridis TaxID=135588 RepID=UPI0035595C7E|nr:hypothetical protein GPJ56_007158 [Histomonas meleagridis]KAH0806178.1 hypothetical protein GO595_000866 [Histomonas meleagridis]
MWFHDSLSQFIDTPILKQNRKLRMISSHFINDVMLPKRSILIEMENDEEDFRWVNEHKVLNVLQWTHSRNAPDSLLVQIYSKTEHGFLVQDDSTIEPIELVLSQDEIDYLRLLEVNDLILIWKPLITDEPKQIEFSSSSIILRLPILSQSEYEDSHDISFYGIIESIAHSVHKTEWTGCQFDLITKGNQRKTVIFEKTVPFNIKKQLSSIREGHFVWLFHLVIDSDGMYLFYENSTLFNLNIIRGFMNSMIITPISIHSLLNFTSGLIKGIITDLKLRSVIVHTDCGCVINSETLSCPRCMINAGGRRSKLLLYHVYIEDGSIEEFDAFGLSNTFDILGYDGDDWESQVADVKEKIIRKTIGKEYVFFVSNADASEFGIKNYDEQVWRIDTYEEGSVETNKEIRYLIDIIKNEQKYEVGNCGCSKFQRNI